MHAKQTKPFGTWSSPISSLKITADSVSLDELRINNSAVYWIEKRPAEKGRCVIVKNSNGLTEDCLTESFSARSKVHEYGGGAYCVAGNIIYFVNEKDQNIYSSTNKNPPRRITNAKHLRYADLEFDAHRNQLICVCEDHSVEAQPPVNKLVAINLLTGELITLSSDHDFYSNPRLSPDGKKLCWLSWDHPNMPWDGTVLWLSNVNDNNTLKAPKVVAGSNCISVFQPEWSKDNILHFVSDESGWWNLYQFDNTPQQLTNKKSEFGLPQWVFSQSCYTFVNQHEILCAFIENGTGKLAIFDKRIGELCNINIPWSSFYSIHSHKGSCVFITASNQSFSQIISADINELRKEKPHTLSLKSSIRNSLNKEYYSYGKIINFNTRDKSTASAIYYAPVNKDFNSDSNEAPPLIVLTHGGPTAMVDNSLDMRKQFWTSRGFALLDVNYSGSTGFGRTFRERLNGHWGIRDAEDCCDAALHAVEQGLADRDRLIIKGSSAGGYTVLCALTFHDIFSSAASYYGIGNLESLVTDTHKFESKYLDCLIGPYPEKRNLYEQRSPLFHTDRLKCPVIFFQGIDDKVVPREQTETMFEALKSKGIRVAYIPFSGEGHGFRKAETIKHALDAELTFYSRIFNLNRDDEIAISIENADTI